MPTNASLANFASLFNDPQHPFALWMWNSVKVSGATALIVVTLTALGAYSFSRLRYRGRRMGLLFIMVVPRDLDEAVLVDGATRFQAFRLVLLPVVRPVLAWIGILTFIGTYADLLLARVTPKRTDTYTLAVGMTFFIRGMPGARSPAPRSASV